MATKIFHAIKIEPFLENLKKELKNEFNGCNKIAVKIHFGEPGNTVAFTPEQIRPITNILKELNINFFLYDSSVSYQSLRSNPESHKKVAIDKGWDKLGEIRTDDEPLPIKGKFLTYEVCKPLTEVDAVLVISHVKGHVCTGFGGAIKNLGMGALTKKSKQSIHDGAKPFFEGECSQCGACARACPLNGIEITDKPNFNLCYSCSNCVNVCPNNSIHLPVTYFDVLLADGASTAQSQFKKFYFVNVLNNISKVCDCEVNCEGIIAKDAGYLSGKDAVAIDKASHDIIVKQEGHEVFEDQNKKNGLQQVDAAQSLGMGKKEYELIELK